MDISILLTIVSTTLLCISYAFRKEYKKMIIYGLIILAINILAGVIYSYDPGVIYLLTQGIFDIMVLGRVMSDTIFILDQEKKKKDEDNRT